MTTEEFFTYLIEKGVSAKLYESFAYNYDKNKKYPEIIITDPCKDIKLPDDFESRETIMHNYDEDGSIKVLCIRKIREFAEFI